MIAAKRNRAFEQNIGGTTRTVQAIIFLPATFEVYTKTKTITGNSQEVLEKIRKMQEEVDRHNNRLNRESKKLINRNSRTNKY